jgi:hypothetical protein
MVTYGKVLKIFDEVSLLVDLGSEQGVKKGDRFVVIEKGGDVVDPDSNKSLGEMELVKAELLAVDVMEHMSVLMTEYEVSSSSGLPLSARMVRDSVRSERDSARRVRMAVAPGEMTGRPAPVPVRTGDLVRRVEQ